MSHTLSSSIAHKPFPVSELPTTRFRSVATRCTLNNEQSSGTELTNKGASKLNIGSPIIITEAPKMIKTAASVPCLRVNSGLLNPGDVGRIVSRKPMNVWAVRLSIGTYLIDEKYFKPLQLDE
ncbi:protein CHLORORESPIRATORY REDUCTION 42, chloroplastic [Silene latifolia]|uniref:protein CHLORORESPIRATORY REDUCTION 42, chloroplastic n=1 Tax=Silene latifolia TaxID=37657 RepID=UPI003D77D3D1